MSTPTLGAVMFVYNGDQFDYCYRETIECMKSFADQVVVLAIESPDGCHVVCKQYEDYRTKVVVYPESAWHEQQGREKLAHFQNEAKRFLQTDYYMCIQADEILHERSFSAVRDAISTGLPAFMCTRHNLWFDPWHQLNVPQERKPCSDQVIRLAKLEFNSTGDGESFDCPFVTFDLVPYIEIFHMGYVRRPDIMKHKVIHMLEQVFLTPHDARLDKSDVFDPFEYFDKNDVKPITGPLPRFVDRWVTERYPAGSLLSD